MRFTVGRTQRLAPSCSALWWLASVWLVAASTGCQSVNVHPRIAQAGHGLECYDTVVIRCEGHGNETIHQRLEAACKDLGYAVVAESGDLELNVFVRDSRERNLAAQAIMVYEIGWNFGVGDACFCAEAKLEETLSGETLLQFQARRAGLTNYSATASWTRALKTTWQRYVRDRPKPATSTSIAASAEQ